MRGIKPAVLVVALAITLISIAPVFAFEQSCALCHRSISENYSTSLHYTIAGIRIAWKQGAGRQFNMSMPKFCWKCHVESCTECHTYHGEIPNMSKCVECHEHNVGVNYEGYLIEKMGKGPSPDIHYVYGLNCTDCHSSTEIHGNGHKYTFSWYAVKVNCLDCHGKSNLTIESMKVKKYNPNLLVHRLHAGKVSCVACHAVWYQTCINCHLDTGKIDRITTSEFHLIVGPDGKLYPAVRMIVSYKNKTTSSFGMILPHTISAKGRPCKDCHTNLSFVYHPKVDSLIGPPGIAYVPPNVNITKFAENYSLIKPDEKFAMPPSTIIVDLHSFGIPLKINITQLGTLIITGVLVGILIHLLKRRITLGRWIG